MRRPLAGLDCPLRRRPVNAQMLAARSTRSSNRMPDLASIRQGAFIISVFLFEFWLAWCPSPSLRAVWRLGFVFGPLQQTLWRAVKTTFTVAYIHRRSCGHLSRLCHGKEADACDSIWSACIGIRDSGLPQKRSTWHAQKNSSNLQELRLCYLVVRQWVALLRQIT